MRFLYFFLFMGSLALAQSEQDRGREVFDRLKDSLVRVKAADSVSSPKASYGTGFVVHESGVIATNYHVISDYVMQPGEQWKIIVELQDSRNVEAELIDLSVIDDLALIRIPQKFSSAIAFEDSPVFKGDKTFSLGLPNDINMSLIEGVYNGVLVFGPYSLIHVTTPLNGGMSGGPTVNSRGRLLGINVSRILFANDISFVVPAERLRTLMKKADFKRARMTKAEAEKKLYSQLEQSQAALVGSLKKDVTEKIELWNGRSISLPKFMKCWSSGSDEPQLPYVQKKRSCRLDHAVFLTSSLDTGAVSLEVDTLDASRINRFSVEKLIGTNSTAQSLLDRFQSTQFFGEIDARELFTPYECRQSFLETSFFGKTRTLRSGVCLRKYVQAKDLYDFSLNWYDFEGPIKTRVSISHSGVSHKSMNELLKFWSERFQ